MARSAFYGCTHRVPGARIGLTPSRAPRANATSTILAVLLKTKTFKDFFLKRL